MKPLMSWRDAFVMSVRELLFAILIASSVVGVAALFIATVIYLFTLASKLSIVIVVFLGVMLVVFILSAVNRYIPE